jgi:N6-adenosine-specific RNA methylase IME4
VSNEAGVMAHSTVFAPLPTVAGGFACVAIDAPLHFSTWSSKGQGRSPSRHYQTYPPEIIATLPVREIAARDAWLLAWWPDVHIPALIETMTAFGFAFSGKGFTWVKVLKSLGRKPGVISTADIETALHTGGGKTTRKNSESVWLGRRGSPKILSHSVREIIVAPVREHSRKPDQFYARAEQFCPGPRLDLFGRQSRPGWTVCGDEPTKFDAPVMPPCVPRPRHEPRPA